ncbi:MAG: ABC transporter ATP-binding protein [Desulfurococcaceae archaeon TW002]
MSNAVVLEVSGLSKRFGGIVALNNVNLKITKEEIVGIIGPNGAGKTTLVNCVTGIYRPDSGRVFFLGEDITGKPPHLIALKGVARTWQKIRPFYNMSVIEAVTAGALLRTKDVLKAREEAMEVLEFVGFPRSKFEMLGRNITLIEHKLVDLARAIATKPKLLFIDEVVAGLRPHEVDVIADVVRKINREMGITLGVIEHVMRFVMSISDRIVVLHEGKLLTQGTPAEVARDPLVVEAYLGTKPV